MNTEQTRISIDHRFNEDMRVSIESDRENKEIEVSQWGEDGKCYYITLTHDQAYKLIDLIKTAMEVKI